MLFRVYRKIKIRHSFNITKIAIPLILCSAPLARASSQIRIIEPPELFSRLKEVVLIDARDADFEKGHISGSQSVHWKDWTLKKPNLWNYLLRNSRDWGKVPEINEGLQKKLQELGLSNFKEIVVVGKPHGWGEEGRFAWLFLYLGASKVSLLDGGFEAWKSQNLPVEIGKSSSALPGNFIISIQAQRRASLLEVIANLTNQKRPLLDARSKEEYQGKKVFAQKRGGHLPGAVSTPVNELYEADGRFIQAQKLRILTGLKIESPISYCVGGVRSALLTVLIEARLGIVGANYDASIWEWSEESQLPLVK